MTDLADPAAPDAPPRFAFTFSAPLDIRQYKSLSAAVMQAVARSRSGGTRRWLRFLIALLIGGGIGGMLAFVTGYLRLEFDLTIERMDGSFYRHYASDTTIFIAFLLFLLGALFMFVCISLNFRGLRRRMYDLNPNLRATSESIALFDRGFAFAKPENSGFVAWTTVDCHLRREGYLVLCYIGAAFIWIPLSAIPDIPAVEAFIDERIRAAKKS